MIKFSKLRNRKQRGKLCEWNMLDIIGAIINETKDGIKKENDMEQG